MKSNDKIQLTEKEFKELYVITEDTEVNPIVDAPEIPNKQDTTPEFLTEEEQEHDDTLFSQYAEYEVQE